MVEGVAVTRIAAEGIVDAHRGDQRIATIGADGQVTVAATTEIKPRCMKCLTELLLLTEPPQVI